MCAAGPLELLESGERPETPGDVVNRLSTAPTAATPKMEV
jgi:hypothetical protein